MQNDFDTADSHTVQINVRLFAIFTYELRVLSDHKQHVTLDNIVKLDLCSKSAYTGIQTVHYLRTSYVPSGRS